MTSPISHCETFADRLADFLEHDVDEGTRAAMEAHARSCDECGPLLADLRSLRIEAANLPELTPSRDLWAGIAQRIQADVIELAPAGARAGSSTVGGWKTRRERRIAPVWFGLAAAGLVAITATVTHEMTKRSLSSATVAVANAPTPRPDTAHPASGNAVVTTPATTQLAAGADTSAAARRSIGASAPAASARLVSSAKPNAQQTYDSEIARLRVVVNQRRGQLDSTTIATIEKNLVIIDDAISQCKQALRKDPASRFLMESLNDAMDTKVQLLRTAASLPSRM